MSVVSGGKCHRERFRQKLNGGYEGNVTYVTKFADFEKRYFRTRIIGNAPHPNLLRQGEGTKRATDYQRHVHSGPVI